MRTPGVRQGLFGQAAAPDDRAELRRVAVVGSGGAGKSTFSVRLGALVGLPVVHLDRHYWGPGWTPTPADPWRRTVAELAAADRWIIDGNYSATVDLRLERADTVVILAYSRWRCLFGVLRRWWTNRGRAVQADGCYERVDWQFLRWVWRYPIDSRPRMDTAFARYRDRIRVVELTTPAAARAFLRSLGESNS